MSGVGVGGCLHTCWSLSLCEFVHPGVPLCHPLVVRFLQAHEPFLLSMHQAPGTLISLGMTICFCVSLCPLHLHPTPCTQNCFFAHVPGSHLLLSLRRHVSRCLWICI